MKILFVRQVIPYPPHGGTRQRGYNLIRELAKRNEVHLLAFHHPDQLPHERLEEARTELKKFCKEVEFFTLWPKKSKLHAAVALATALLLPTPFSVLAQRNTALNRRLREICGGPDRPDLVHFDTIGLAPFSRDCKGIPCTLGHQNVESQLMERRTQHERGLFARTYGRIQTRRLLRYEAAQCPRFATNIMVSEADVTLLQQVAPGSRAVSVENGVDVDYFQPSVDGDAGPTLIYTGGMDMFANRDAVEWFIDEILPIIRQSVPEVRFLAVGQYPSEKARTAANRDPLIEVPGFVPDVRPWVARASVYVVPLRVGGGTRVKIMDAMAQGKAIVSTSVGAEGIEGTLGVHRLHGDTPAEFAARVVELLNDPTRRAELGRNARALAESRYAWPALGAKLSDALQAAARR